MIIRIRFYDNMSILTEKYKICSKLQNEINVLSKDEEKFFIIEFYCVSDNRLQQCIVHNDTIDFKDINIERHCVVDENEFCYILVDLAWKTHEKIKEKILDGYNIESNKGKVKMLLYTHAAPYQELNCNYEMMKKKYENFQFYKKPTFIVHEEHYVNHWCKDAAEVFFNEK